MEDFSFFIGIIGNIISLLVFLSPMIIIMGLLWNYKTGGLLVATINGFGVVVETLYIIIFFIYAPKNIKVQTASLVGSLNMGFFLGAVLVTHFALEGEARINVIGFICAGLNIIMYGSPLSAMRTVVTTKSVEYMPFLLSFFLFLNGGIWAFYAFLVRDYFLGVPNGIGFVLGAVQLVLYAIYRNGKPSKNVTVEEEEPEYQQLLISSFDH